MNTIISAGQWAQTGNIDQTITSPKNKLQNSELKYRGTEDTGKHTEKKSTSVKLLTTTKLHQHVGRMKRINDKKRRLN